MENNLLSMKLNSKSYTDFVFDLINLTNPQIILNDLKQGYKIQHIMSLYHPHLLPLFIEKFYKYIDLNDRDENDGNTIFHIFAKYHYEYFLDMLKTVIYKIDKDNLLVDFNIKNYEEESCLDLLKENKIDIESLNLKYSIEDPIDVIIKYEPWKLQYLDTEDIDNDFVNKCINNSPDMHFCEYLIEKEGYDKNLFYIKFCEKDVTNSIDYFIYNDIDLNQTITYEYKDNVYEDFSFIRLIIVELFELLSEEQLVYKYLKNNYGDSSEFFSKEYDYFKLNGFGDYFDLDIMFNIEDVDEVEDEDIDEKFELDKLLSF